MIKYIKGDLLESDCDVIAHGCNCFGSMGAGIAKQIANKFPKAFKVDFFTERGNKDKLGTFTVAEDGKLVYNLYTQYKYGFGLQVDYVAIKSSFEKMKTDLYDRGIFEDSKIGIPMIGAGLGGGDWEKISKIINEIFVAKEIYVYTL
tara:strand:+ start:232 stop:672 length:441 start_codon:yes stop_codon:yes gene_type:complete